MRYLIFITIFCSILNASTANVIENYFEQQLKSLLSFQSFKGNTDSQYLRGALHYNYNKLYDYEWTLKLEADQQQINELEYKRYFSSIRFGKSITRPWFLFLQYSNEQDGSRDLYLSTEFTAGSGYWLSNNDKLKLSLEISIGRHKELPFSGDQEESLQVKFTEYFTSRLTNNLVLNQNYYFFRLYNNYEYYYDLGLENLLNDNLTLELRYEFKYRDIVAESFTNYDSRMLLVINYRL